MGDARERMIDAAERIAAERGIAAMSLREVQIASGQRNKSAAHYHFSTRDGLIEAVVAARMGAVNERRLELLDALPTTPALRDVVEALVHPLADATIHRHGSCWARFLFHGWADPSVQDVVRKAFAASSYRTVRSLLDTALAGLPTPRRQRRIDQAVGLVVMSLAATEGAIAAGRLGPSRSSLAELVDDLVDGCCGLLTAPARSTATAGLTARRS